MQGNPGNFACGIRNPGNFCFWNPESWALESGFLLKVQCNPVPVLGIRNTRRGIQDQHYVYSLTWSERLQGTNCGITVA